MKAKVIAEYMQFSLTILAAAAIFIPIVLQEGRWPEQARDHLEANALEETGARNTVSAIYLDYRLFDTLGETIVLLVAVSGTIGIISRAGSALARGYEDLEEGADALSPHRIVPARLRTVLLEVVTGKLGPVVLMFGLYVMLYGHLSPGGGFQGGVVIASGIVFLALGGRKGASTKLTEASVLSALESAGFLLLVLAAFIGMFSEGALVSRLFPSVFGQVYLPPAAFIVILNTIIGIKVGAGIGFMCIAMLGRVDH